MQLCLAWWQGQWGILHERERVPLSNHIKNKLAWGQLLLGWQEKWEPANWEVSYLGNTKELIQHNGWHVEINESCSIYPSLMTSGMRRDDWVESSSAIHARPLVGVTLALAPCWDWGWAMLYCFPTNAWWHYMNNTVFLWRPRTSMIRNIYLWCNVTMLFYCSHCYVLLISKWEHFAAQRFFP